MILRLIKRMRCKHQDLKCITNFYGDMINVISTHKKIYRSAWVCKDCGRIICKERLEPSCKVINYMPETRRI